MIKPAQIKELQDRTLSEIGGTWQPQNLRLPRLPALFGQVANKKPFDTPVTLETRMTSCAIPAGMIVAATEQDPAFITPEGLYIENLPIKFPGTDYHIPAIVWDNFGDLLVQQTTLEKAINPHIDNQYVYLTIQQGTVAPATTQRPPGTHIDGFQKACIFPPPP